MQEKRVLITGASGFMGKMLVQQCLEQGAIVRVLQHPEDASSPNSASVQIVRGDITQKEQIAGCTQNIDIVFHLAGVILAHSSQHFQAINVDGTRNIIEECRSNHVKRFVYISSTSVGYTNLTHYAHSKFKAEQAVQGSGLDWTIVRPTLVCDAQGSREFNLFLQYLQRFPIVLLPAGGVALKRPVHTSDIALGLVNLASTNRTVGKVYDLCGGDCVSIRQMAQLCAAKLQVKRIFVPVPAFLCRWSVSILDRFIKKPALPSQAMAGFLQNADCDYSAATRDFKYAPKGFNSFIDALFPRE